MVEAKLVMAEGQGNPGLQAEIAHIEQQLAAKRAALEQQQQSGAIQEMPHEKETLREVFHEKYSAANAAPTTQTDDTQQAATPAPAPVTSTGPSAASLPPELQQKVQALVNDAFLKDIDTAVKEARATNNGALIDAFHDLLIDELYDQLVERGKIKRFK